MKFWPIGLAALALAGCGDPPIVQPGIIGVFEGTLYNTGNTDLSLHLQSQLVSKTQTSYRFQGTTNLGNEVYAMQGQETAGGIRYENSPPEGRIVATLAQQNGVKYCLELRLTYVDTQPSNLLGGQLKQSSSTDLSECSGTFMGSVDATRQP